MEYEFYNFNDEVWYRTDTDNDKLTERSTDVVNFMLDKIYNLYPDAYAALDKMFKGLNVDMRLKRFRMVQRFCKCNFGEIDNIVDIDNSGKFTFERVSCPLRGECQHECVICQPKFNSRISAAEMRVLKLVFEGKTKETISETLFLSVNTVSNHIRNAFVRIGIHSKAEFIDYAHRNHLFD
ncbi:MAG: helix-turn-helix transcriptional regulator [Paludibacteraceae bacterium]|nr:helix-turn-helix transcriptional regulator [Paludibacteraceae bacterium]